MFIGPDEDTDGVAWQASAPGTITASSENADSSTQIFFVAAPATPGGTVTATITNVQVVMQPAHYDYSVARQFDMAAFDDSIFFANGDFLYRIPSLDYVGGATEWSPGSSILSVRTCCNHNNRLVLGGFSGSYFSSAQWIEIFNYWKQTVNVPGRNQDIVMTSDQAIGEDWIMWSESAGGALDKPYATFLAMLGLPDDTAYAAAKDIIFTRIESGQLGFAPCRFAGNVVAVRQLGADLLVYGTRGISRFKATPGEYVELPKAELNQGVLDGTVAGDEEHQRCVTSSHMLYATVGDGYDEVKSRLGYVEYLETLTGAILASTWDPEEKYYWVSDGTHAFCFTRTGLGQCDGLFPTSVCRVPGIDGLIGFYYEPVDEYLHPITQPARLVSNIIDTGNRGLYSVSKVKVSATDTTPTGWAASIWSRTNRNNALVQSTAYGVDPRGQTTLTAPPFTEMELEIEAADRTLVDCERVEVEIWPVNAAGGGKVNLAGLLP